MVNVNILPPKITITEEGEYADKRYKITIKNPNSIGVLWYELHAADANNPNHWLAHRTETVSVSERAYYINRALYFDIENLEIIVNAEVTVNDTVPYLTVAEMCENTRYHKFNGITTLQKEFPFVYLKAFCNMPGSEFEPTYMYWEYSKDGISWEEYDLAATQNIDESQVESVVCSVFNYEYTPEGTLTEEEGTYVKRTAWRLATNSSLDYTGLRPDLIRIPAPSTDGTPTAIDNTLYRAKMLTLRTPISGSSEVISGVSKTEKTNLGVVVYTPVFSPTSEFLESDIFNVSMSKSLYCGATLYAYGNPAFRNNLIASYAGESVRPLSKMTPLEISENTHITTILPWKNYLVGFTEKTIHLISSVEDGYTTTTVNTFIGVPEQDSRCCVPTLNGIIFKSGPKLYMLYPNIYAGADNILNITDISTKIASYLENYESPADASPFAIGTDLEYILMLPQESTTLCLRYNYTSKIWTFHEYPVVFISYEILNVSDIHLFGYQKVTFGRVYAEYILDAEYDKLFDDVSDTLPYTDVIYPVTSLANWETLLIDDMIRPIAFELDSGQKSDSLNKDKQFVETKFNVTTLHAKDSFPMKITIHIDGFPSIITRNVYTDSAFWKEKLSHTGTLSTTFASNGSDIFNVFRQMFLRYSGKGRSIRHLIEGESLYPFKIYEIDYRYRNLNTKL